jgi:hypothetical protein
LKSSSLSTSTVAHRFDPRSEHVASLPITLANNG